MKQLANPLVFFLGLIALPVALTTGGTHFHLEQSKNTAFCLSCHEMEPYFESLQSPGALAAEHYLDRKVPRDQACYTCHTSYAMFGDLQTKIAGVQHLLVHYLGEVPEQIELYRPYHNRECLNCHRDARSFEQVAMHQSMEAEIRDNSTSCLDCHGPAHDLSRGQSTESN